MRWDKMISWIETKRKKNRTEMGKDETKWEKNRWDETRRDKNKKDEIRQDKIKWEENKMRQMEW